MISLIDIPKGTVVYVQKIVGDLNLKRRIMEMGLTKGVKVFIKTLAPFGDPIEIQFRNYCLSIRKNDAKNILVSKN